MSVLMEDSAETVLGVSAAETTEVIDPEATTVMAPVTGGHGAAQQRGDAAADDAWLGYRSDGAP